MAAPAKNLHHSLLTERDIQNVLWSHYEKRGLPLVVPNVSVFHGVSDLITVSKRMVTTEHEIKITRADFRRDMTTKHLHLTLQPPPGEAQIWKPLKQTTQEDIDNGGTLPLPNYFYFVVPYELVEVEDVPVYAGLMYVYGGQVAVMKEAPRLHGLKISEEQRQYMERGMTIRYWQQRTQPPKRKRSRL